jgi:hypothetical protein
MRMSAWPNMEVGLPTNLRVMAQTEAKVRHVMEGLLRPQTGGR